MEIEVYRKILEELETIYPEVPSRGNWHTGREPELFHSFELNLKVLIHRLKKSHWKPPHKQEASELRARAKRLEELFETEKNQ